MYALTARLRPGAARRGNAAASPGEPVVLTAADGQAIAATWYAAIGNARATVVVAPATGVPQGFYRRFALWLAERQVAVLSFDYRGVGRSRPQRLRGFEADFSHWALDLDAALAHALQRSSVPVSVIGHSIGGFLAPLAPRADQLQCLVLVGAQTAYWRDWPAPQRYAMAALWHGLMPVITLAAGFFPGRALRLGEDLPRGVALQWATRPWRDPLAHPDARTRCARALPPIHMVAARDDIFATDAAQTRLQARLGAGVQRHRLEPHDFGLRRIGHFGVFREPAVWPRLLGIVEGTA